MNSRHPTERSTANTAVPEYSTGIAQREQHRGAGKDEAGEEDPAAQAPVWTAVAPVNAAEEKKAAGPEQCQAHSGYMAGRKGYASHAAGRGRAHTDQAPPLLLLPLLL